MLMKHKIRSLEKADRTRWEELFRCHIEFHHCEPTESGLENVWGWIFDPEHDFWCDLIVDPKGEIVGFAHYLSMPDPLMGQMVIYLADMFVDPSARLCGAGRSIVDHVLAISKAKGSPAVQWFTAENNYAARRIYDSYQPKTDYILYNVPT
jgi:ribosomal protein S18 acetylase RimI-like enzyme